MNARSLGASSPPMQGGHAGRLHQSCLPERDRPGPTPYRSVVLREAIRKPALVRSPRPASQLLLELRRPDRSKASPTVRRVPPSTLHTNATLGGYSQGVPVQGGGLHDAGEVTTSSANRSAPRMTNPPPTSAKRRPTTTKPVARLVTGFVATRRSGGGHRYPSVPRSSARWAQGLPD